jgi:chromosome segregation ATPase
MEPDNAAPAANSTGEKKPRSNVWVLLTVLLAAAVVGVSIWAFSAQSDANDAQAKLNAQEQAEKPENAVAQEERAATPAADPAPQSDIDPDTQQKLDDLKDDFGATGQTVDELQDQLDQAREKVDDAEQTVGDARTRLESLRAEAASAKARVELTRTCLRGALDALDAALSSGGVQAAVKQIQAMSGDCRSAPSA